MELSTVYQPRFMGYSSPIDTPIQCHQRKLSPEERSPCCYEVSLFQDASSPGCTSSSSSEGSFSPESCPKTAFMFENHSSQNAFHCSTSLSGLKSNDLCIAFSKTKMASLDGLDDSNRIEPKKAVGHGRPRSYSNSAEASLYCYERACNGDKRNHESYPSMTSYRSKGDRGSIGARSPTRKTSAFYEGQMSAVSKNHFDQRLSLSASRGDLSHRLHRGLLDLYPFCDTFSAGNNHVLSLDTPDLNGYRVTACEPSGGHGDPRPKAKWFVMNGWHSNPESSSGASLEIEKEIKSSSFPRYPCKPNPNAMFKDHVFKENRTSVGVIGGERKSFDFFVRRRRSYDDYPGGSRKFSSGFENRPWKEDKSNETYRARSKQSVHSPSEPYNPGEKFCSLCKVILCSDAQVEEHLKNTKHLNRLAKYNSVPYKKFCDFCKVNLNSESQAKEHFSSGRHEQTVAKSQKAPSQNHLPLIIRPETFSPIENTKTEPCDYQLELYRKSMETNAVCFLPTGTGKRLVAALVVAHMLQMNPSRQVVFLVDRVLLVLQQSDYLRKELGYVRVPDLPIPGMESTPGGSFNHTRPIRIGAVCGEMRKLEGNARIYEQDVLIITADCYRNHLNNGTLRFEDVSLLVLDEAHHCNKDHPYNVIIRDFYLKEDALLGHRPKILGLTASPAGETSLDKTTKRLQRLLGNLGGAKLLVVEENVRELEEKTSRALPVCISTAFTCSERDLMEILVEYATKVFNVAVRLSELKDYKDIFQPSSGSFLSIDDICPVLRVIDNILIASRPDSNTLSALLHFQLICEAVCTLQECGQTVALNQLVEIASEGCPHGFEWAESMSLPCNRIKSFLELQFRQDSLWIPDLHVFDSGIGELIDQLCKLNWTGTSGRAQCLVLVLVERNRTALCLAKYLSNCPELLMRNVRTTCIVGGGARSGDEDTSIMEGKGVISKICAGYFQVVVATSVAEDGLELPRCDLVIQMAPLNSVKAVEKIREGARQKDARFVAICRNEEQARKIMDLLRREENMQLSARVINGL